MPVNNKYGLNYSTSFSTNNLTPNYTKNYSSKAIYIFSFVVLGAVLFALPLYLTHKFRKFSLTNHPIPSSLQQQQLLTNNDAINQSTNKGESASSSYASIDPRLSLLKSTCDSISAKIIALKKLDSSDPGFTKLSLEIEELQDVFIQNSVNLERDKNSLSDEAIKEKDTLFDRAKKMEINYRVIITAFLATAAIATAAAKVLDQPTSKASSVYR